MIRAIAQELLLRALEETGVLAHLDLLDQVRRGGTLTPLDNPQTDYDRKWNEFVALHMRAAPERPRRLWLGLPRLRWEPGLRLRKRRVITWRIHSSTGPDRWSVAIGRLLLMFGPHNHQEGPQRQEGEAHLHDWHIPLLPVGPPTQGVDQWACLAQGCIDRLEDAADRAYGRYARAVGSLAVGGARMPVVPNARVRRAWVEAIRGALGLPPGVKPGELAPPQGGSRPEGVG